MPTETFPARHAALLRGLSRFGFAARGSVFLIIGLLTFIDMRRWGPEGSGPREALLFLAHQPLGNLLLAVTAMGLLAFALWQWAQALWDPEFTELSLKRVLTRGGYAISGVLHAGLAITALRLLVFADPGNKNLPQDWTAVLLTHPPGRLTVALTGVVIILVSIYRLWAMYADGFAEQYQLGHLSRFHRMLVSAAGRAGSTALEFCAMLIGLFLLRAAWNYDAKEAAGLGEALARLAQQPLGPGLFAAVALGLCVYGFFSLVLMRFRKFDLEQTGDGRRATGGEK